MKVVDFKKEDKPVMSGSDFKALVESFSFIARANMAYYKDLRKEGFSEEQALELVKHFKWGAQ